MQWLLDWKTIVADAHGSLRDEGAGLLQALVAAAKKQAAQHE
jgi:hypothetical protein